VLVTAPSDSFQALGQILVHFTAGTKRIAACPLWMCQFFALLTQSCAPRFRAPGGESSVRPSLERGYGATCLVHTLFDSRDDAGDSVSDPTVLRAQAELQSGFLYFCPSLSPPTASWSKCMHTHRVRAVSNALRYVPGCVQPRRSQSVCSTAR
jgi:hypothetical protein